MNTMTVNQAASVLNAIVAQMSGSSAVSNIATPGDFAAVAQTALLSGRDPVMNILNQMWSRTIFAVRPRRNGLDGLYMDMPRWGNAVRKLSPVAGVMLDDDAMKWPVTYDATQQNPLGNGQSVDQWTIQKQDFQQVNFYGTAVYEQAFTTFVNQFDTAFRDAQEFAQFNAMNLTERANDRERYRESVARALQVNYIGALLDEAQTGRVIHLLTEYNAATGLTLTVQTVMQPANYANFIRWMYARLNTLAMLMGEDSTLFQTVVNAKRLVRQTRPDNLRVALLAQFANQIKSMALSTTYNDEYLSLATFDAVPYWQGIATPNEINITPVYTDTTGAVVNASQAVNNTTVIGIMHDRDALGYSDVYNASYVTPINAKGEYWNTFNHTHFKTLMDMTEKGIVLCLD